MEDIGTEKKGFQDAPFSQRFTLELEKNPKSQLYFKATDFEDAIFNSMKLCRSIKDAEWLLEYFCAIMTCGIAKWYQQFIENNPQEKQITWPPNIEACFDLE